MVSLDSFNCRRNMTVAGQTYAYFNLTEAERNGLAGVSRLPCTLKILLENLLRFEDGRTVTREDIKALAAWAETGKSTREIAYRPARVLMQDFTGVPAVVDLAAMRDAIAKLGGDPGSVNPLVPVDLVIDHSVMVDYFGGKDSFSKNVEREYERNGERYKFLKWGARAFDNFRVAPPGAGICHQVNLEYLARTVWTKDQDGIAWAYPDTLVGTDSHTTMINGLAVLGWGVGGIEAEAAMLGQPISMLIPEVIGFKLTGKLPEGATATDLVLTVVERLRRKGVVGKFVEFFGKGLDTLSLEDTATIANMSPEYGATCGFFPVDHGTLDYLRDTGRDESHVQLVEAYCKAQGLFRPTRTAAPIYTDTLELDMSTVTPSLAGPKRPQDRVPINTAPDAFTLALKDEFNKADETERRVRVKDEDYSIGHGDVVIAAITSCTNTSNPSVMLAAGLVARNALKKGLKVKPWVKTSLAPGSRVVTDYLEKAHLQDALDTLGFNLVGYGCTTCIGNSGPLPEKISRAIEDGDLIAASVLSGNRNFEGRVSPDVRANYLASPPLVVAYAIAGTMNINLTRDPIGYDDNQNPVLLRDIWPSPTDIAEAVRGSVTADMFTRRYGDVFKGDDAWRAIETSGGLTYDWPDSTYVTNPPFFEGMSTTPTPLTDISGARILGLFADSITTDHISPAGAIKVDSPAGLYLQGKGVAPRDFNSYGARRGNHDIMMRGTFANIRIKNQMTPGVEGGVTRVQPSGEEMSIFDAAMQYAEDNIPLVVFGGKEYGTGSSRDWAAKGSRLLGLKAVICESFERIHRSNLIGMGVLPLQFLNGESWRGLGITGKETIALEGIEDVTPRSRITLEITFEDSSVKTTELLVRIDTDNELDYVRNGGILHHVLRQRTSV